MSATELDQQRKAFVAKIATLEETVKSQGGQLDNIEAVIADVKTGYDSLKQAQDAYARQAVESAMGSADESKVYLASEEEYAQNKASVVEDHRGPEPFLKTDRGAIRLMGHYQRVAGEEGRRVWRWGFLDDPTPRSAFQLDVQRALTVRNLVRGHMDPERRRSPRCDAELYDALRAGPEQISRIFADGTGIGAEWIPDRTLPELERDVLARTNFTGIFDQRDVGPGGTIRLPYKSGDLRVYKRAIPSGNDPALDVLSDWSTDERTIDTVAAVCATQVDRDATEDSIIAVIPEITMDMRNAYQFADDDTWVNGDTAGTHQDAIASWDTRGRLNGTTGLGTTADHRVRWKGLRAIAYDIDALHSNGTTDQNTAQTEAGMRAAIMKLAIEHLIESDGQVRVVIAVSPEYFFSNMLGWSEFSSWDKVGALASILTGKLGDPGQTPGGMLPGQVGFLWGRIPVVLCYTITADLAATGKYTGSGSTTGSLQFDRSRYQTWVRKGMMLESDTEIRNNTVTLVSRKRSVGRAKDEIVSTNRSVHWSFNLTY